MKGGFYKKLKLVGSFAIVIGILILPFFNHPKANIASDFSHPITIGSTNLNVAYAKTDAERAQGLSGTGNLIDGEGMLFFFDSPTYPAFWMKDMNYPLDIIWIDQNNQIVGVQENLSPSTYPQTYTPGVPIKYVLEVPAGFYEYSKLKTGDTLIAN